MNPHPLPADTGGRLKPVLLGLLAACLLLAGCGPALRSLPPAGLTKHKTVQVFHNGFHSGLMLTWPDPDLAFLDGRHDDKPAALPWLEIGYGADAWTRLGGGSCTACRLAFTTSAGVLMLRHQPECRPVLHNDGPVRLWAIDLDRAGWDGLLAHIRTSMDASLNYPRKAGATDWVAFTTTRWSILHNCHDWTAECLMAMGLDLNEPSYRSSDSFEEEMDEVMATLAKAGITVVGRPRPVTPPQPPKS